MDSAELDLRRLSWLSLAVIALLLGYGALASIL